MNLRPALVLSTLLMVSPWMLVAQNGAIVGRVANAATGEPIEGALISIVGARMTTTSAPDGGYSLLGVPPGTHAVNASRLGYATVQIRGVEVLIDRHREVLFRLHATSRTDSTEVIDIPPAALDPRVVLPLIALTSDKVIGLPSVTLSGALGVNGGYVQLPRAAANLSLSDFRRGVTTLPSVRGARPDATLYLLDGIEVSNPVYGFLPILAEPLAASGIAFSPAHVNAEYGGAMSGLIAQALREGGAKIEGAFHYEAAELAGRFGAGASEASGASVVRGFLSGPMPIRPQAFRFVIAGHAIGDRLGVIRSGDTWLGSGDNSHQQAIGKLTYAISRGFRLSLTGLAQQRSVTDVDPGFISNDSVAGATTLENTRMAILRAEKRFARTHFGVSFAHTRSARTTCSIWHGVCIEDRLQRIPLPEEIPPSGLPPRQTPYAITGQYFGGEAYRTNTVRADVVLQATDHHQIKAGIYATQHDIGYADVIGHRWLHGNVVTVRDVYRVRPREFASYAQNVLEHDLITIHFGIRYTTRNQRASHSRTRACRPTAPQRKRSAMVPPRA